MKSFQDNITKHSTVCLLKLALIGPAIGLALLGGHPIYPGASGVTQSQHDLNGTEKTEAFKQTDDTDIRRHDGIGQEAQNCVNAKRNNCLGNE